MWLWLDNLDQLTLTDLVIHINKISQLLGKDPASVVDIEFPAGYDDFERLLQVSGGSLQEPQD